MTDYRTDLIAMRTAAHQREWTTLQDTLKRLLTGLEPIPALEIPALQINQFFPRFESYYPDASWVRELFMTVAAYASAPNELPAHAVNQFPQPGCGNFVGAVLDLARAVQMHHTIFERYSFMTNATANALLSDLMDFYYGPRPDEWRKLTEQGDETDTETGLPVRQVQYMRFWLNSEVVTRDTAAWLTLIDHLETRLK